MLWWWPCRILKYDFCETNSIKNAEKDQNLYFDSILYDKNLLSLNQKTLNFSLCNYSTAINIDDSGTSSSVFRKQINYKIKSDLMCFKFSIFQTEQIALSRLYSPSFFNILVDKSNRFK